MQTAILRDFVCVALLVAAGAVLAGCEESAPEGSVPGPSSVAEDAPPYDGPPVEFRVSHRESGTDFSWTIRTPAAGWRTRFKGARSRPGEHASIMVVLYRPDAVVDGGSETLHGEYRHGASEFPAAELLVEIVPAGGEPAGDYRVAATHP